MENHIRIYPNAISDEFCDELIQAWHSVPRPSQGETPARNNSISLRNDEAVFLDRGHLNETEESETLKRDITGRFMPLLEQAYIDYFQDIGLPLDHPLELDALKVQRYEAAKGGGYYAFHFEQATGHVFGQEPNETYARRYLTWLLYLNDVPDGEGETEFLYQGLRVKPKKGDLVIFPAFFTHTHRGNPVYTTDKYIATGWVLLPKPEAVEQFMQHKAAMYQQGQT